MKLIKALRATFLALLGACATLGTELKFATADVSTYRDEAGLWGVEPSHETYITALQRWPWAQGAQLHRRSLLLNLSPSQSQLSELDGTQDSSVELKLLHQLLGAKFSKR
jgi:hypothetical protein